MSDLHPTARALLDAAKRGEASFPPEMRARVHRSVRRRALALGAAVATASTASAVSKAATLIAGVASSLAVPGALGALAGVAFFVLRAGSTPPPLPSAGHPGPTHVLARSAPTPLPSAGATPVLVLSALSAISPEPVAPVPAPRAAVVVPPSKLHALAVAPVTPSAAIAGLSRATATREERPAEPMEAAESPAQRGADDPLPGPTSAPAASGVQIATAADVADDLDVLRQVHAALRGRRSEVALSLLDRAARGLEAGPLAEQAQGARVSALCQLGRLADAREATHRFLVAWPASPLAMRLRGGCDALEVNAKPNAD